jgi:hypothetical protein
VDNRLPTKSVMPPPGVPAVLYFNIYYSPMSRTACWHIFPAWQAVAAHDSARLNFALLNSASADSTSADERLLREMES